MIDIILGDVFVVCARFRATLVVTLRCNKLSDMTAILTCENRENPGEPTEAADPSCWADKVETLGDACEKHLRPVCLGSMPSASRIGHFRLSGQLSFAGNSR